MSEQALVPVTSAPNLVPLAAPRISMTEMLFDPERFAQAQRVAQMLVSSPLVPEHIRGKSTKEGIANVVMSLALASEMQENPIVVMQNIYFVSGKAGWSASYMIAKANRSGIFRDPVQWRVDGAGKDLAVTAFARLSATGTQVEATVDMKMAEAEKWTRNDKYRSMPEHMLRWRSATMLIRLYAPQVMLGYRTVDELQDVRAAAPQRPQVQGSTGALAAALDIEAEVLPEGPAAEAEAEPEREPGQE